MNQENGADVALEVGGQKLNVRNVKSLNTIATVVTMFLAGLILYIIFTHQQESKQDNRDLSSAMREQTTVIREQNCLVKFPEAERRANSDFCKQITGAR
jgi:hypothetical protein